MDRLLSYLREHGVFRRKQRQYAPSAAEKLEPHLDEIIRLHGDDGLTQAQIGERFGVTQWVVSKLMTANGHHCINRTTRVNKPRMTETT